MHFETFEIDIASNHSQRKTEEMIKKILVKKYNPDEINSKGDFFDKIEEYLEKINNGKEIICFEVDKTKDLKWNYTIRFDYFPNNQEKYGTYPDITLSEKINENFGWNCICSRQDIFKDIDDQDPYWGICIVNKKWYLCDLGNSILLGPYTDGINEFEGNQGVEISFKLGEIGFKFGKRIFELEKLKKEASH